MKKSTTLIIVLFLLMNFGCSNYYEELENSGFTKPTPLNQPRMLYPKIAKDNNFSGKTEVILLISKTGKVDDVQLVKSSGYAVLDSASVEYSKSLIFNPAMAKGEPISTRIKWSIEYKFSDQIPYIESYVNQISQLYKDAEQVEVSRRYKVVKQIFDLDKEFITRMLDGSIFNTAVAQVILPEISAEWDTLWEDYPLSFLLYHDLIQRFPDYDSLVIVKEELRNSLRADIQYIEQTSAVSNVKVDQKKTLILKIKNFIKNKYPKINLEEDSNSDFNS